MSKNTTNKAGLNIGHQKANCPPPSKMMGSKGVHPANVPDNTSNKGNATKHSM